MTDQFKEPRSKEEFLKQAADIPAAGAKNVIIGLKNALARKIGTLQKEIQFYEEVIKYKTDGTLPERFNDDSQKHS